jgi:hypothetical protein
MIGEWKRGMRIVTPDSGMPTSCWKRTARHLPFMNLTLEEVIRLAEEVRSMTNAEKADVLTELLRKLEERARERRASVQDEAGPASISQQ